MKLVSYKLATPLGDVTRIGAMTSADKVLDLARGYGLLLEARGLTQKAARRIAAALFPNTMVGFIEGGEVALDAAREILDWTQKGEGSEALFGLQNLTMLAPISRSPLIRDFLAFETHLTNIYPKLGREIPPEWYNLPVYYKGNPGSVATHSDDIPIPASVDEIDIEFEIALVIGKGGSDIPRERAFEHVFGYMIFNDLTERKIQAREMSVGLGPAKSKDFAKANIFGPYLVTADEIPDIYTLEMEAKVNDALWCKANLSSVHWRFEDIIAYASQDEYLYPGEILGSGTVGDGSGAERDTYLKRGDVVELKVEKMGTLRNRFV
ncbi:fumarylacetoacetate hydrolase family protein [soil metagenome]